MWMNAFLQDIEYYDGHNFSRDLPDKEKLTSNTISLLGNAVSLVQLAVDCNGRFPSRDKVKELILEGAYPYEIRKDAVNRSLWNLVYVLKIVDEELENEMNESV